MSWPITTGIIEQTIVSYIVIKGKIFILLDGIHSLTRLFYNYQHQLDPQS